MKKTREEKAITLIALIITIVVLLILAIVAINAVTGDGIIQHAVNAKTEYEKAQSEESSLLGYYEGYLNERIGWKQNKTIVSNMKTGQTLEVGDYVNYVSGVSGYTDTKGWVVLGAENGNVLLASKNLPNKVSITGHKEVISKLNQACKGYDVGEHAIEGSARSITIEDIDKITGYNPLKTGDGKIYGQGTIEQYQNEVIYTMDKDGNILYELDVIEEGMAKSGTIGSSDIVTTCENIDGNRLERNSSLTITATHYGYNPISLIWDENVNTTTVNGIAKNSKQYQFFFEETVGGNNTYYTASIATYIAPANEGWCDYGVRIVQQGAIQTKILSYSAVESDPVFADATAECGVRAVVTLEPDVQLTKQSDGSYNID